MEGEVGRILESLEIAEKCNVTVVEPKESTKNKEEALINHALSNPINAKPFNKFIQECKKILIVVNDATRATPTNKILKHIIPTMKDKKISIIVATGAHREPTEEEYQKILGEYYKAFRDKTTYNDARKREKMKFFGTTSRGTKVYVNKAIVESDCIVVIGSTEPHYFAGFTGGRKGIVPGIAGYETIEHNHFFATLPEARILRLSGNPVHEDLIEAVLLATRDKHIFAINTVLDKNHRIYACTAGDLIDSFKESTKFAKEVFTAKIDKKADIVIAVTNPPLDINLYQAHKSLENVRLAVKKGGVIILIARCREGIGPRNFYDLLSSGKPQGEILEEIKSHYKLGYHKVAKFLTLQKHASIYIVTEIDKKKIEKIGLQKFDDLTTALKSAIREINRTPCDILVVKDAAMLVPIPVEDDNSLEISEEI